MEDKIISTLETIHDAKDAMEINDLLGLKDATEYKEVSDTLQDLVEKGIVFKTKKDKYLLLKNAPGIKSGRLTLNKKGFGFVIIPNEDDVYIDKDNLNGATHDDMVVCEVFLKGTKKEGRIIRILKRDLKDIVGEIKEREDGTKYFQIDDDKIDLEFDITKESLENCVPGHKVLVHILKQIGKKKYLGEVIKIIGHITDPGVDILSIAYKYAIYPEFGSDVDDQVEAIPNEVSPSEMKGRTDLTNEVIFTIDGDDTKDIDDAVSIKYNDGIYTLGVHIADVSNYVVPNTPLGDKAYERGTSSYLANTVIPMLPRKLSNGICSLNPNTIRLAISCVMDINESGKVVKYDIFPSIIKSRKQMTYKKVNDIIERNIVDPEYAEFADDLRTMKKLADILRKEKIERGYIDFELDEGKIIQDEEGHAIDVVKRSRESGEMLIEDFMIAANETVATHIYNMDLPFIYRIHENPKAEKVEDFMKLVKLLGYEVHGKLTDLSPKSMQKILKELADKKEFKILSSLLLRSMRKAEYSKENLGHFGLASKAYTHFTSPIRRFPDLIVHRLLRTYLFESDLSMTTIDYYDKALVEIAAHSSEREVAATNAERDVFDMKAAEYMEGHIGEEYTGIISTVMNFGFFVELDNLVEGLVHVNSLKGDYFIYNEDLLCMIGKSTKKQYRIGDKIKIKVVGASKENSMIDFEIVEDKKDGNNQSQS